MIGRVAMSEEELEFLRDTVKGWRTYVEIGVLWGGSLIEAAKAEPGLHLWGVDPFTGYYGGRDMYDGVDLRVPTYEKVIENLREAGVIDRVRLIQANSYPWPLDGMVFDVGLIDGCHELECVKQDWESLSKRCKVILFHDIDDPNIFEVVNNIEGWWVTYLGRMARVERD